jgi:ABC-type phosphonate transport system ATPase subunit
MGEEDKPYCTSFLFSDSSFLRGTGTVFNIWGNFSAFNYSRSSEEADRRALECDWGMVHQDMKAASDKVFADK